MLMWLHGQYDIKLKDGRVKPERVGGREGVSVRERFITQLRKVSSV